jgi:hypothetical protein
MIVSNANVDRIDVNRSMVRFGPRNLVPSCVTQTPGHGFLGWRSLLREGVNFGSVCSLMSRKKWAWVVAHPGFRHSLRSTRLAWSDHRQAARHGCGFKGDEFWPVLCELFEKRPAAKKCYLPGSSTKLALYGTHSCLCTFGGANNVNTGYALLFARCIDVRSIERLFGLDKDVSATRIPICGAGDSVLFDNTSVEDPLAYRVLGVKNNVCSIFLAPMSYRDALNGRHS